MEKAEDGKGSHNHVRNETMGVTAQGNLTAHTINVNMGQGGSGQAGQGGNYVNSFRTLDAPMELFQGRTELLERVHKALQERRSEKGLMRRIVALAGIGGMGKTEIARKLAEEYSPHYENIAWINAETEQGVRASFVKLAQILSIPHPPHAEASSLAELVYRHISHHVPKTTLFIFDHANQLKTDGSVLGIYDYLPTKVTTNHPLILLTSQMTDWRRHFCQVIPVTELNEEESMNYLRSSFGLSKKDLEKDDKLTDLLQDLVGKLGGYPLALGLAVANISYIPGQDTLKFLKQSLTKYIECVKGNEFFTHQLDNQIGASYPHNFIKVWNIAMSNLKRRKYGREANCLLSILIRLATPKGALSVYLARKAYELSNPNLGVTFPGEKDASFYEALHELQAVGLVVRQDAPDGQEEQAVIKVQSIVRKLAKDENGFGIQKTLLYNLETLDRMCGTFRHYFLIDKDFLWTPQDGIASWALESAEKTLLWLYGLRYLEPPEVREAMMKDPGWRRQLTGRTDGEDITRVAEFIIRADPASFPDNNGLRLNWPWSVAALAVKVKFLLSGRSRQTQLYFEALLLSKVERAVARLLWDIGMTAEDGDASLSQLCNWPSSNSKSLDSFKSWICHFDFITAIYVFSIDEQMEHLLRVMIQASRFISLKGDRMELVSPAAIFRLADANFAVEGDKANIASHGELAYQLYFIGNPAQAEELLEDYRLLDYLPTALKNDSHKKKTAALGIVRQLVLSPEHVHQVIQHEDLMATLEGLSPSGESFQQLVSASTGSMSFSRFTSDEETRKTYPRLVEAAVLPDEERAQLAVFLYTWFVISFHLYTITTSEENELEGQTSAQKLLLLSPEKCESALSHLATSNVDQFEFDTTDWRQVYGTMWPFLSKSELEEDEIILTAAMDKLRGEVELSHEGDRNEVLLAVLEKVVEENEFFLSLLAASVEQGSEAEDEEEGSEWEDQDSEAEQEGSETEEPSLDSEKLGSHEDSPED